MTLNEKVTMKDLLSEGLYILMQQKPFEKITIKQICDKTGVIVELSIIILWISMRHWNI